MLALPLNTDPEYETPSAVGRMDRFFLRLINDKRDLPFVYLTLKRKVREEEYVIH